MYVEVRGPANPRLPRMFHRIYNLGMARASSLHRLQLLDWELDGLRNQLAATDASLEEAGGLQSKQAEKDLSYQRLVDARTANAQAESLVDIQRSKIEATDAALYGGTVRNPKELSDLQQESVSLRKHLTSLEERLLETMVRLEEAEAVHAAVSATFELGEAEWVNKKDKLERERRDTVRQLERLEGEREAAMSGITPDDLEVYTRLRASLGGTAVAEIREMTCSACGLVLAASVAQRVRASGELVRCTQCNRILYAG